MTDYRQLYDYIHSLFKSQPSTISFNKFGLYFYRGFADYVRISRYRIEQHIKETEIIYVFLDSIDSLARKKGFIRLKSPFAKGWLEYVEDRMEEKKRLNEIIKNQELILL